MTDKAVRISKSCKAGDDGDSIIRIPGGKGGEIRINPDFGDWGVEIVKGVMFGGIKAQPNLWWRLWQYLLLGWKWKKR